MGSYKAITAMKTLFLCSLGFALLLSFFSLIFYFGDWTRLAIVSTFGFFIGFIGALEIEPKAFKHAWLIQTVGGFVAGFTAGLFFQLSGANLLVASIIGTILGWLAPFWLKYVAFP